MNTETKKHIDAARQVLVGVVPNPTGLWLIPTNIIDHITNWFNSDTPKTVAAAK